MHKPMSNERLKELENVCSEADDETIGLAYDVEEYVQEIRRLRMKIALLELGIDDAIEWIGHHEIEVDDKWTSKKIFLSCLTLIKNYTPRGK